MAAGREELQAVITAQDKASRVFKDVDRNAEKMSKGVGKSLAQIKVTALAATAAVAGMIRWFTGLSTQVDRTIKLARRLDVGFEFLQVLEFQAEQTGVELNTLNRAMGAFARRVGEAQKGNEAFAKGFRELRIDVNRYKGETREVEKLYRDVIEAMSGVSSAARRAAIADTLFSEAGRKLAPVLQGGAEAMRKFREEAERLNILISKATAESLETANDGLDRMARMIRKPVADGLAFLADIIEESGEGYRKATRALMHFGDMLGDNIQLSDSVTEALKKQKEAVVELTAAQIAALQAAGRKAADEFPTSDEVDLTSAAMDILTNRDGAADRFGADLKQAMAEIELAEEDLTVTIDSTTKEIIAQDMATREAAQSQFAWAQAHAESKARMDASEATAKKWISTLTKINEGLAKSRDKVRKQAAKDREREAQEEIRAMEIEFQHLAFTAGSVFETVMGRFLDQIEEGRIKLQEIGRLLARTLASVALRSASEGFGSAFASIFSAQGNVFGGGRVQAFASGGVIGSPVAFPLRGGMGIAGEAGPEAIMPLKRDSSGRLGVGSDGGGGGVTLNVSIHAIDNRSIEQMAAENQDAFAAAVVNVVAQRPEIRNALRANLS